MNESRLIILNNNQVCVLLKKENQAVCFYDTPKKLDKIKYDVSNYLKAHPAEIQYRLLSKGKLHLSNSELDLKMEKNESGYRIQLNDFPTLQLSKNADEMAGVSDVKTVFMPWIRPSSDRRGHFLSTEGAFSMKI